MFEEITTPRLLLRPYRESDAVRFTELVNDPLIYRNVGRVRAGQTLEQTREIQAERQARNARGESAGRIVTLDGELIGLVGGGRDAETGAFEIGYWIAPHWWGQGLATEAAGAFRDHLVRTFGAHTLTADYFQDNPASGRVLTKIGFVETSRGEAHCMGRDQIVPIVRMTWTRPAGEGGSHG
ncbi:MAG: GNAT family N-acetyltransferase [Acidobacteria bacterium]|nr:GNAT family N-acetyltransferase [Acidobacteriota bacterium]